MAEQIYRTKVVDDDVYIAEQNITDAIAVLQALRDKHGDECWLDVDTDGGISCRVSVPMTDEEVRLATEEAKRREENMPPEIKQMYVGWKMPEMFCRMMDRKPLVDNDTNPPNRAKETP